MFFLVVRVALVLAVGFGFAGCGRSDPPSSATVPPPLIAENNLVRVQVVVPPDAGPLLNLAREDLVAALGAVTGAGQPPEGTAWPAAIQAVVDENLLGALGEEGYRLSSGVVPDGRPGISVTAATAKGAAYGFFQIVYDLGVLNYHPEARFTPPAAIRRLPWKYDGSNQVPKYASRGFHEHTQHPIPMSDYYLRPSAEHREAVSRYLRWLARNRQNAAFFHMLKTVDLDSWFPYIADVAKEANELGIRLGAVTSFVDQQQNNYKLIDESDPEPAELQIRKRLNRFMEAGLSSVVFQIGSSEFTKPNEDDVLFWLNTATSHIRNQWPGRTTWAWIHITCELPGAKGGSFFHLPLAADTDLGAWVHTTMFYALDHPAPVYKCENFDHQKTFLAEANEKRPLTWFPETAWWLGFDNNCPIILPITGWSRQYDVQQGLSKYDVTGHITFTTGREWTYWQYDHYVAQLSWSGDLTWSEYVGHLEPMWGEQGASIAKALRTWTDLQVKHLYEENPRIMFYLSGELPQDEIGAQAGVYARPPKIAYSAVYGYGKDAFAEWKSRDYDMLVRMEKEYGDAIKNLPDTLANGTPQQQTLYREMRVSFEVTHKRISHAIALYGAVISARAGNEPQARQQLSQARAITEAMRSRFQLMEALYRSPIEILARDKPESLTSYPFGYLADTSTAYFWQRRDDQLETFLDMTFNKVTEAWALEPEAIFAAPKGSVTMEQPDDPIAGAVIASFIPPFLVGVTAPTPAQPESAWTVHFAEDFDASGLPDPGTEQVFAGSAESGTWQSDPVNFRVVLRDNTGAVLGDLTISGATISVSPLPPAAGEVPALQEGTIVGEIESGVLVSTIQAVGGIDTDGASNLVKQVYQLPMGEPLPDQLPLQFRIDLAPLGAE